jgi:hypothetical protein
MVIKSRFGICALSIWGGLLCTGTALAHENEVRMIVDHQQRCFISNSVPDHDTGTFPNAGNPHSIQPQDIRVCVPGKPPWTPGTVPQYHRGPIGIAINGVLFRPGTADYYDATSRRGFSRDPGSGWNLDGMGARDLLGLDENNAHVDERGLYHYHGVADALIASTRATLIGYAADGYDIHFVDGRKTSSYRLKEGNRPTAPFGPYDGTYNEDWEYEPGSGDLDECNGGRNLYGRFVYYASESYPFLPRCLWGEISPDFTHRGPPRNGSAREGRRGEGFPPGGPPPPRR